MNALTTRAGTEMLNSVTPIYSKDSLSLSVFETNGKVMEEVSVIIEGMKTEMYPQNATWTLIYWEQMLGIKTNKNLTNSSRIQKVLFELNKYFTITRKRIESSVNIFVSNKNAKVVEDENEYSFMIEVPSNNVIDVTSIHNVVNEIKPAHLAYLLAVIEVQTITLRDYQYEFGVPYPITNRFRTTDVNGRVANTRIKIQEHTHSFGVPYPITNVLRTEDKNGKVASERVKLQYNAYAFHVLYPICSQFHTASIGFDSQKEYVQVTTDYRSNEVLYKRAGTIFAGEGDI